MQRMPPIAFNAVDVETANADRTSICQIGLTCVRDGGIEEGWSSLIDPEDWFDPFNVGLHGIKESDVKGAPALPDVWEELRRRLQGSVLVSHTSFDRSAFERAQKRYGLPPLEAVWLDSAKIARRCWPEWRGRGGHGLKHVAAQLGIEFQHHDALEDAKAAAAIVLRAGADSGASLEEWIKRAARPASERKARPSSKPAGRRAPRPRRPAREDALHPRVGGGGLGEPRVRRRLPRGLLVCRAAVRCECRAAEIPCVVIRMADLRAFSVRRRRCLSLR